jgi:hypothetical protein
MVQLCVRGCDSGEEVRVLVISVTMIERSIISEDGHTLTLVLKSIFSSSTHKHIRTLDHKSEGRYENRGVPTVRPCLPVSVTGLTSKRQCLWVVSASPHDEHACMRAQTRSRSRARCAARVYGLGSPHLTFSLSPLSPLFFSFLLSFHQHRKKATQWAFLLTAKQDTVKTSNRILDTLWEALSG